MQNDKGWVEVNVKDEATPALTRMSDILRRQRLNITENGSYWKDGWGPYGFSPFLWLRQKWSDWSWAIWVGVALVLAAASFFVQ